MHFTIRRGAADDANDLTQLAIGTFRDTYAEFNTPENLAQHLAESFSDAQQARELQDPALTTLVAEHAGTLVGYAQLRSGPAPACVTARRPIELWRFYVDKRWHGKGVAQPLMDRVFTEAGARGADLVWLGVWERNARARAYYAKSGFADVGTHIFMVGTDAQTDRVLVRPVD